MPTSFVFLDRVTVLRSSCDPARISIMHVRAVTVRRLLDVLSDLESIARGFDDVPASERDALIGCALALRLELVACVERDGVDLAALLPSAAVE